mmetsp:Transcript_818/g.1951  ORF Transcript_818/g.1951 Transcript_818/m.1951 type:complete len:201 (-) Transcript_818:56-658(-)
MGWPWRPRRRTPDVPPHSPSRNGTSCTRAQARRRYTRTTPSPPHHPRGEEECRTDRTSNVPARDAASRRSVPAGDASDRGRTSTTGSPRPGSVPRIGRALPPSSSSSPRCHRVGCRRCRPICDACRWRHRSSRRRKMRMFSWEGRRRTCWKFPPSSIPESFPLPSSTCLCRRYSRRSASLPRDRCSRPLTPPSLLLLSLW